MLNKALINIYLKAAGVTFSVTKTSQNPIVTLVRFEIKIDDEGGPC